MKLILQYVLFCLVASVLMATPSFLSLYNPFIEGPQWGLKIGNCLGVILYWFVLPIGVFQEIKKRFFTVSVALKQQQSSQSNMPVKS